MPLEMVSEEKLRFALSPYRIDPERFEAGVRERIRKGERLEPAPLRQLSPLAQAVASLLPMEFSPAGQVAIAGAASPAAGLFSKLLAYAAFPAISVFLLLGSAIFGARRIRQIQSDNSAAASKATFEAGQQIIESELRRWGMTRGWLIAILMFAIAWFGATWALFLGYIASMLLFLYVLKSLAKIGIGNRRVVGACCMIGLMFLGFVGTFAGVGDRDIHFLDQVLLFPLMFTGGIVVSVISTGLKPFPPAKNATETRIGRAFMFPFLNPQGMVSPIRQVAVNLVFLLIASGLYMGPILRPATPQRLRSYVESFDHARFSSASWHEWEIVASQVVKEKPAPDLSLPGQLLSKEIADPENPVLTSILDSALHVGLATRDQIEKVPFYKDQLDHLLDPSFSRLPIVSGIDDWVIRAAVLRNDLTPEQRDFLAERLHALLARSLQPNAYSTLEKPVCATRLLEVIGRPVDPLQYQKGIHALLMRLHHDKGGLFARIGGFKSFEEIEAGDLNATADAIELMETYGVPQNLNLNLDRSFLRPSFSQVFAPRWIAAVTLERLNRLPGAAPPSWAEILYAERTFLAAIILIGLCIYATAISPIPAADPVRTNE